MAVMWPRQLPSWIVSDSRRAAERHVFAKLRDVLGNDWAVFYSRPWWGIARGGGEVDGEADFIVVHPDFGLLFLEVKGGGISFNPENGQWQTKDRYGITHNIKNPVSQAMTCKHRYLERLRRLKEWPKNFIRFRHGVVFPDSAAPSEDCLSLDGHDLNLFCFSDTLEEAFGDWIRKRLEPHTTAGGCAENGPGHNGIALLEKLIADPVRLRVPIAREINGDLDTLDQLLTGAQLALVSIIETVGRALLEGGAGTGKTVLATEMAARCAEVGESVLYCCRSVPLAREMARRMSGFPSVHVKTFRELTDFWSVMKFSCRRESTGNRLWDIIIIDEAQDFMREWWDCIEDVAECSNARLRVLADSNQAVYCLRDDLETRLGLQRFPLSLNLRNTKRIARATESLYRGPLVFSCGPEGIAPCLVHCSYEEAKTLAAEKTLRLIRDEEIRASDIAVLVPDEKCAKEIRLMLSNSGMQVTDACRLLSGAISVDTVVNFKGLEAPVILLVTDGLLARNEELSYVGVSRARALVLAFGPLDKTPLGRAFETAAEHSFPEGSDSSPNVEAGSL